jgi:hypothetical protein
MSPKSKYKRYVANRAEVYVIITIGTERFAKAMLSGGVFEIRNLVSLRFLRYRFDEDSDCIKCVFDLL